MKRLLVLAGLSKSQKSLARLVSKKLAAARFELTSDKPELIIVVGGDGSLLHYMRELGYPATPFLGIDGGSLGFFQEVGKRGLNQLVSDLHTGNYHFQKLHLLQLGDASGQKALAFNEFAIERASARAAHISLTLDNHKFEKFIGDGLIISTAQGSTAYASAAGGAIIPYDIKAFQVVPSNPHQSALYKALMQPLVIGSGEALKLEILDAKSRPIRLVADGHELESSDSFELGLSRRQVAMLRTKDFSFYARLSQKLIG